MQLDPKLDRMLSKWESDGYKHVMLPGTSMTCDTAAPLIRSALEASPQPANPAQVTDATDEAVRLAGDILISHGLNAPEQVIYRAAREVLETAAIGAGSTSTEAQIEHMVQQFLRWKLPDDFNPDGGIQFVKRTDYGHTFEPVGTNLFDYRQAKAMVQHMLEGLPAIGAGGQAVAWWHVGKWGNGTSCADESNIFCDAWETAIAANLPTEIAEAIVEAHNAALSQPHPADERVVEAPRPNWNGWLSIDTAPEDCRVILATVGNWVGEAIMLRDEDTGEQIWTWVDTGRPSRHSCYGWMPLPEPLSALVPSGLRPDGFDGPTGAE